MSGALIAAAVVVMLAARYAAAVPARAAAWDEGGGAGVDWAGVVGVDAVVSLMAGGAMSAAGLDALKRREGFSAFMYQDAGGYSIGYGHFIKPWEGWPAGISEGEAAGLLAADVATAENAVTAGLSVPVSQSAFDALVSFAYNVGGGAFKKSTLLRLVNAGDIEGAAAQFSAWVYSTDAAGNKTVNPGLLSRRADEAAQFLA